MVGGSGMFDLTIGIVHRGDSLGEHALLLEVVPAVLREVHKRHETELNGKEDVERAQACPTHHLVRVQASVNVVESEYYSCCSCQPVRCVPERPHSHSTAPNHQLHQNTKHRITPDLL